MATTGIWKIESRLDHVIKYTTDVEKTINEGYGSENYKELHNVLEYATSDYKTEKQFYVSGINCLVDTAYDEMTITKKQFNKTSGILGFHAFQSFKENEVSSELAHEIGIRLAEEMWGDRFEIVVSTHLNTKHIHNHFVINSVSFKDGKKYYDKRETYAELRHLSDSLCEEYGLSVLEEKECRRSKINYANYYKGNVQRTNYHTIAKEDIDNAIEKAYCYQDFENLLRAMNYEIYYRYDKLTIRKKPYRKNIRVERAFGSEYSLKKIRERIETTYAKPNPNKNNIQSYYDNLFKNKKKSKGLKGLYLYYCYLLKIYPKQYPNKYIPPEIRVDIKKLDDISSETKLLVSNKIETYEQFFSYKTKKVLELNDLLDKRSKLWYKFKKSKSSEEKTSIRNEIDELSKKINPIQEEVRLLKNIEKRTPSLEQKIKDFESKEKERKESDINEFIK